MNPDRKPRALHIVTALWAIMFGVGVVVTIGKWLPVEYSWTATITLILGAAVVVLSEARTSPRAIYRATAIIAVAGLGIESVGVLTGYPFGAYQYTGLLWPPVGVVPLAIAAAWVSTLLSSWRIASHILARGRGVNTLLLTGGLALALDFALEPMATRVAHYWVWTDGHIPLQNYLSWFLIGVVGAAVLGRIVPGMRMSRSAFNYAVLQWTSNLGFFLAVCWSNGVASPMIALPALIVLIPVVRALFTRDA